MKTWVWICRIALTEEPVSRQRKCYFNPASLAAAASTALYLPYQADETNHPLGSGVGVVSPGGTRLLEERRPFPLGGQRVSMKLTRASSYALYAVAYMVGQRQNKPVTSHHIAKARGIPEQFLLKVLKPLVSARVLH